MTKLERAIRNPCTKNCEELDLEYDPKEGHFHVFPQPPECIADDITYDNDPPQLFLGCDYDFTIDELKEIRDWLNAILEESK